MSWRIYQRFLYFTIHSQKRKSTLNLIRSINLSVPGHTVFMKGSQIFSCFSSFKTFLSQIIKLKCHCVYFYSLKLSKNQNFFCNSTRTNLIILFLISTRKNTCRRGNQQTVSVNYLFGRSLIPSDFHLELSWYMRTLMPVAFGL